MPYAGERTLLDSTMMTDRMYLSVQSAAKLCGYSIRHFRRCMIEDVVPSMWFGHKQFILGSDYNNWVERMLSTNPLPHPMPKRGAYVRP